jgi:hypothetical protein
MNTIWFSPNLTPGGSLRDPVALSAKLRFTVPYTTPEAAGAALREAARLAGDLSAAVDLVAVQVIPMACPLMPDARTAFLKEQLGRIAGESQVPAWPTVILTRDLDLVFRRLLPLGSLVLIAVPTNPLQRWIGGEATWARRFKRAGYDVVLTPRSS